MSTSTITKTTSTGATITAVHSAKIVKKYFEGCEDGERLSSSLNSLKVTINGKVVLNALTYGEILTTSGNIPSSSYGIMHTHKGDAPITEEGYKLAEEAIKEAKEEAEKEFDTDEEEVEKEVLVVNPEYVNLTDKELSELENNYDNINNEGAEGFNPYRDNYLVKPVSKSPEIYQVQCHYEQGQMWEVVNGELPFLYKIISETFGKDHGFTLCLSNAPLVYNNKGELDPQEIPDFHPTSMADLKGYCNA